MANWLNTYLDTTETSSSNGNPTRHLPFYALCQAVLYIFAYRCFEIFRLHDGKMIIEKTIVSVILQLFEF